MSALDEADQFGPETDVGVRPRPSRQWHRANALGESLTLAYCAFLLARAPTNPLTTVLGGIHDAQARALFHGRWNLRLDQLVIEAFRVNGEFHTYFGIWPTVLRMPVLAVTDRFDGSLTGPSILLAVLVALRATAGIRWELRCRLHDVVAGSGSVTMRRGDWWGTAGFQVVVGTGSVVAFLASRPLVYHEMEMWGIAGALAATYTVLRFLRTPGLAWAAACGAAGCVTLLSRPSVGFGVLVMFAGTGLLIIVRRAPVRAVLALAVAAALPVVLYGAVNVARFGAPFALPLEKQEFSVHDKGRQLALAANGGSLFGIKYAPTTAWQYARPDAIRFERSFPFVNFPHERAHVFGRVVFDTLDRSTSAPSGMPGLFALAVVGAANLIRGRNERIRKLRITLLPVVVGGLVATVSVLTIAYVANRYLADFMPLLVVLAAVGLQAITDRSRTLTKVVIVGLCVASLWIGTGLAVVYQRDLAPSDPDYGRGTEAPRSATSGFSGRNSNNN